MSVRKTYACDLCNSAISEHGGIGVIHRANGEIRAVYLRNDGVGHHLCNLCVAGLPGMLADLNRTAAIQDELDQAETEATP
jgi:hypothetical protein